MQDEIFFTHNPFNDLAEVRASPLHGWGVFARRLIPKGTAWWQARRQDVLVIERSQYEAIGSLPCTVLVNGLLDAILHYSYYQSGRNRLFLSWMEHNSPTIRSPRTPSTTQPNFKA